VRGLFITGTGTGVGKTIVSAALLAAMRAAGEPVWAHKPVVTGLEERPGQWPHDHELLALAAGIDADEVAPLRYQPPVSPHFAAALAGVRIDTRGLVERARTAGTTLNHSEEMKRDPSGVVERTQAPRPTLIVEGVGGLLVPLTEGFTVRDLALELCLPLLIAANPELGSINHTLLTIEAARAVGLPVAAVVLTPWPADPTTMEHSNRDTIATLGAIEVETLASVAGPNRHALASAGEKLPWRRWLRDTQGTSGQACGQR
jgi:dethiobiotin synthetase